MTIQSNAAGSRVVQAWNQVGHGGLAGTRRSYQGYQLAGIGTEGNVLQDFITRLVVQGRLFLSVFTIFGFNYTAATNNLGSTPARFGM